MPRHPLPVVRLGHLAGCEQARGLGVSQLLVRFALFLGHGTATRIGCVLLPVDAKHGAIGFYEERGCLRVGESLRGLGKRPVPTTRFPPLGSVPTEP